MRQFVHVKAAILTAVVATAGCQWLPSKKVEKEIDHQPLSIAPTPGLLVGPGASGEGKAPQELESKAASQACLAAAAEMEKAGQTEEAIRLYEKGRADHPAAAAAISRRLGILYDKAGEFGKATVEYDIALKAGPADADLLSDIGYSYYSRGDWAAAEKHLRHATKVQSGHKRAWLNLGLTLAAQGHWQECYDSFLMAVTPGDAHCNVGFCMATQGLTDDAKGQYRKALDIDPASQLARTALNKLENPPAPGTVRQATAKAPADPTKIRSIMEIMEQQKAAEGGAKVRSKGEAEAPLELDIR